MKPTALIFVAGLCLSACTDYQEPKANCFNRDTVNRATNNLIFLLSANEPTATPAKLPSGCLFVPIGGSAEARGQ